MRGEGCGWQAQIAPSGDLAARHGGEWTKDGAGGLVEACENTNRHRVPWSCEEALHTHCSFLPQQSLALRIAILPPSYNGRVRGPKWHTSPKM